MSIDSWIFINNHIANKDDGGGVIVERKVLWNCESGSIGIEFADSFNLDNGDYRNVCHEDLHAFADECIASLGEDASAYDLNSLLSIKQLLESTMESDNFSVSVDY
jgi:hypothetical protein